MVKEVLKLMIIFGSNSSNSFSSWLDTYDIYKTRVIVCSLFFAIYYFLGQLTKGTLGARVFKIESISFDGKRTTIKQAFLKALYYGMGTWAILLIMLSLGKKFPFYTNSPPYLSFEENSTFNICLWVNFIFLFSSAITMLFDKQNRTLAEIISKTKTIAKVTDNHDIKSTSPTIYSEVSGNNPEHLSQNISNDQDKLLIELNKLINIERRKFISGENSSITDLLEKLIIGKQMFSPLDTEYKRRFGKGIVEHLASISSSYSTIYFYVKPLVELKVCEERFPHKILPNSINQDEKH